MNRSVATALPHPGIPMRVRGIEKRFGAFTALDHVSLDVAAGGLLGPSGCGKTTCCAASPASSVRTAVSFTSVSAMFRCWHLRHGLRHSVPVLRVVP